MKDSSFEMRIKTNNHANEKSSEQSRVVGLTITISAWASLSQLADQLQLLLIVALDLFVVVALLLQFGRQQLQQLVLVLHLALQPSDLLILQPSALLFLQPSGLLIL